MEPDARNSARTLRAAIIGPLRDHTPSRLGGEENVRHSRRRQSPLNTHIYTLPRRARPLGQRVARRIVVGPWELVGVPTTRTAVGPGRASSSAGRGAGVGGGHVGAGCVTSSAGCGAGVGGRGQSASSAAPSSGRGTGGGRGQGAKARRVSLARFVGSAPSSAAAAEGVSARRGCLVGFGVRGCFVGLGVGCGRGALDGSKQKADSGYSSMSSSGSQYLRIAVLRAARVNW